MRQVEFQVWSSISDHYPALTGERAECIEHARRLNASMVAANLPMKYSVWQVGADGKRAIEIDIMEEQSDYSLPPEKRFTVWRVYGEENTRCFVGSFESCVTYRERYLSDMLTLKPEHVVIRDCYGEIVKVDRSTNDRFQVLEERRKGQVLAFEAEIKRCLLNDKIPFDDRSRARAMIDKMTSEEPKEAPMEEAPDHGLFQVWFANHGCVAKRPVHTGGEEACHAYIFGCLKFCSDFSEKNFRVEPFTPTSTVETKVRIESALATELAISVREMTNEDESKLGDTTPPSISSDVAAAIIESTLNPGGAGQ
jgi:hypothetical protein